MIHGRGDGGESLSLPETRYILSWLNSYFDSDARQLAVIR